MTLTAAFAPLAAYAIFFQTAVYLSLPARLRHTWAPMFTGLVGAGVAAAAGALFGFDTIGLTGANPTTALLWGSGAALTGALVGAALLSRPSTRNELADPRIGALDSGQFVTQVAVRIPVFTALIEEVFFRGVLHAALMALYSPPIAIWLGAGLFGLWHIGPGLDQAEANHRSTSGRLFHTAVTVVATTLAGAFLVWLRIETGSIWAPPAVHAAVNMTMAVVGRRAAVHAHK